MEEKTWLLVWREWGNILLKEIRQIIYQFPLLFSRCSAALNGAQWYDDNNADGSIEYESKWQHSEMAQEIVGRLHKSSNMWRWHWITVTKREEKIHFVGNFYRNFKRFTEQQHKEEKWEKSVDCWFTSIGHVVVNSSSRGPGNSQKKIALCLWPPPRKQFWQAEKTNV